MKTYHSLAHIISVVFHPVFIPFFLLFILMFFHQKNVFQLSFMQILSIVALSFVWNLVLPGLIVTMLIKRKTSLFNISFILIDRHFGLFVFGIFYFIAGFISQKLELHQTFIFIYLFASLLCFCLLIINLFIRISIHVTSWSVFISLTAIFTMYNNDMTVWFVVVVMITGVVAWARRILLAHSHTEIIAGYIVGLSLPFLWLYLLK